MRFFHIIATALVAVTSVHGSNVIDLTPDNFDEVVGSGKFAMVEFFAEWCGHCKNLFPTWEQLADEFKGTDVVIAKVDADKHRSIGTKYGVKGFPTLKLFSGSTDNPEDYSGGDRSFDSIKSFITDKAGVKSKAKKEVASNVVVLNDSNFDQIALNKSSDVLVEFYAPWCGHCKNMAPAYEKLANAVARDEDLIIAKVNGEEAPKTAERYEVRGFPTIKFFAKGSDEPIDYRSGRDETAFLKFLKDNAGCHRLPSGQLDDDAGRVAQLDDLLKTLKEDGAEAVLATVKQASGSLMSNAYVSYYVRALEKLVKKPSYILDETKRLEGILAKGSLTPEKTDEFSIRKNILRAFEAVKDAVHEEL